MGKEDGGYWSRGCRAAVTSYNYCSASRSSAVLLPSPRSRVFVCAYLRHRASRLRIALDFDVNLFSSLRVEYPHFSTALRSIRENSVKQQGPPLRSSTALESQHF